MAETFNDLSNGSPSDDRWRGRIEERVSALDRLISAELATQREHVDGLEKRIDVVRDVQSHALTREAYEARHEDLAKQVNSLSTQLANMQGRTLVAAGGLSLLLAGLISALANHL